MNVLILGTSNSVLKNGWVCGFRDALGADLNLVNASVGASPSSQFAGWCASDLTKFNFVIFDAIVNDENLGVPYVGSRDFRARLLFEMFSTIASQTNLIVLGFANDRHALEKSDVYNLYAVTTTAVDSLFISVVDFALTRRAPTFKDHAHISVPIAYEFGMDLAKKLASWREKPRAARSFKKNFKSLNLHDITTLPTVEKRNSQLRESFTILSPGDVIDFANIGRLIGFYIDSADTNGFCLIKGKNSERMKSLRYKVAPEQFKLKFVPILNGIEAQSIKWMESASPTESSPHEEYADPFVGPSRGAMSRAVFWTSSEQ